MIKKDSRCYASDFSEIKKALDAELGRRGKAEGTARGQSVGSMASYKQEFSNAIAVGETIRNEHIQKLTQPLSAITGSSIAPENGNKVTADVLAQAA